MSATNDGGPAFPNNDSFGCAYPGMTLRDWFAGNNVAGLISNAAFRTDEDDPKKIPQELARLAYELADAMIAAREKGGA